MTHKEIAKLANVSMSTVSKALSGSKEISSEIAENVKRIAIESGYFQEKSKRKITYSKHKTVLIAVVCPEISGVWYSKQITAFKQEVERRGGQLAVYVYDFDNDKMNRILEMLVVRNDADGIILLSYSSPAADLKLPLVCIEAGKVFPQYDTTYSDIPAILNEIIAYLKKAGHKEIGFVGESHTMLKYDAYMEAMSENGLCVNQNFIYIIHKRFEEIGYEAVYRIMQQETLPTAIITAYDEIALAIIHELRKNNISVPEDISVVGMNDIASAAYAQIPLTTVRFLWQEPYAVAVERLFDRIFGVCMQPKTILIPHKLMLRKTVAAPAERNAENVKLIDKEREKHECAAERAEKDSDRIN